MKRNFLLWFSVGCIAAGAATITLITKISEFPRVAVPDEDDLFVLADTNALAQYGIQSTNKGITFANLRSAVGGGGTNNTFPQIITTNLYVTSNTYVSNIYVTNVAYISNLYSTNISVSNVYVTNIYVAGTAEFDHLTVTNYLRELFYDFFGSTNIDASKSSWQGTLLDANTAFSLANSANGTRLLVRFEQNGAGGWVPTISGVQWIHNPVNWNTNAGGISYVFIADRGSGLPDADLVGTNSTAGSGSGVAFSINGTNVPTTVNFGNSGTVAFSFDGTSNVTATASSPTIVKVNGTNVTTPNLTNTATVSYAISGSDILATSSSGGGASSVSVNGTNLAVANLTNNSQFNFSLSGSNITLSIGTNQLLIPDGSITGGPGLAFFLQTNVGLARIYDTTISFMAGGNVIGGFGNGTFGSYDGLSATHIRATNSIDLITGAGANKVLVSDASGIGNWQTLGSIGGGTVTSVAMSVPSQFQVTGSPITTSGTLAVTLTNSTGTGKISLDTDPSFTRPALAGSTLSGTTTNNSTFSGTFTNTGAMGVSGAVTLGSTLSVAGNETFATDNSFDIGATNATRARTLFLGTSLDTPKISTSGNLDFYTTALTATTHRFSNGQIVVAGAVGEYAAGSTVGVPDVKLLRDAAATWQMGSDSATPIAQTFKGADARAGTDSNTAGGNMTIASGRGTGTNGLGSSLFLQTAAVTTSGTGAGTLTTRLTIDSAGAVTIGGVTTSTNGLGSLATDAAVNIAATGWTNTFGKTAVVYLDGTAVTFTVFNNAGTAIYTNAVSLTGEATVILQPNGAVTCSGTGVAGRATPF